MPNFNETWTVQPHEALVEVGEGILTVEGSIIMPLGRFPRRMTVITLGSGGSLIWSPVSLRDAEMGRIEALGPVRYLVVPNQGHRLDIKPWRDRYPDAVVIVPPSAVEAVAEAVPVGATEDVVHDPAIRFELVAGTKADEFALTVSRPDGTTLILNDILSNVRHPRGFGAKVMARLLGFGVRRPRTSRPVKRMYVADADRLAAQFQEWSRLPGLKRIIVSHGDVIHEAPGTALERAAKDFID